MKIWFWNWSCLDYFIIIKHKIFKDRNYNILLDFFHYAISSLTRVFTRSSSVLCAPLLILTSQLFQSLWTGKWTPSQPVSQGPQSINYGAYGIEKFLLKTQVSGDFAKWSEPNNKIQYIIVPDQDGQNIKIIPDESFIFQKCIV
jgi:hypothetical protein